MAYPESSSYGPRSTFAGPANNAPPPHFPQSQSLPHQQQSISLPNPNSHSPAPAHSTSHFHPNPNPIPVPSPNPYPPHPNHSNAPSPPRQPYSHPQPAEAQAYQAQRQPYAPNQIQNGGGLVMQPPMTLPDDHFKRPYLPQQQYMSHGQPPANFIDQRQKSSAAVSDLAAAQAFFGAPTTLNRFHTPGSSYPPTTTMTVTAAPVNPPSTQSTPTSEVPSQSAEPSLHSGGLSSLDQQRVDALLQVNNLLLQEVTILQKLGLKPSPQSPQQTVLPNNSSPQATPAPPASAADPTSTPQTQTNAATKPTPAITTPTTTTPTAAVAPQQQSLNAKKYVEFMTRIKTNIMFLVNISDQAKDKPRLPHPSHLEAPPLWLNPGNEEGDRQLDSLREEYAKLRELWPDWKPEMRKPQAGGQQAQAG